MSDEKSDQSEKPDQNTAQSVARKEERTNVAGSTALGVDSNDSEAQKADESVKQKTDAIEGKIVDPKPDEPNDKPGEPQKSQGSAANKSSLTQRYRDLLSLGRKTPTSVGNDSAELSISSRANVGGNYAGNDMFVEIHNHSITGATDHTSASRTVTWRNLDVALQRIAEKTYGPDIDAWAASIREHRVLCLDVASGEVSRHIVHALCSRLNTPEARFISIDGQAVGDELLAILRSHNFGKKQLIFVYDTTAAYSDLGRHAKRYEVSEYLKDHDQYVLISYASRDDGGPAIVPEGAVGPHDGLAFLINQRWPAIAEPAAVARQIVDRNPELREQGEFRRFKALERAVESLVGLSAADLVDRFGARLVEICHRPADVSPPAEPITVGEGDELVQRSVMDSLRFVALHFRDLELPEFLLTVRCILAWLDDIDPIEIIKLSVPAPEVTATKPDPIIRPVIQTRNRCVALDRDTDYFLAKAALAVRSLASGTAVVEIRDASERTRLVGEFTAKPMIVARTFEALLSLATDSLSFRWDWHGQMANLCAAMALRSPAETSRELLSHAVEAGRQSHAKLEANKGTFVRWQWAIFGLLDSSHPGASELLNRLGNGLMGRSDSRNFALKLIGVLDDSPRYLPRFRELDWLGLLVDTLSPEDELVDSVVEYFEKSVRTPSHAIHAITTAVTWYDRGEAETITPMRFRVAHRFLVTGLADLIIEWLTSDLPRSALDFPLFQLLGAEKSGPELVSKIIAAWPLEDPTTPRSVEEDDGAEAAIYIAFLIILAGKGFKGLPAGGAGTMVQTLARSTKQRFAGKRPRDFRALSAFKRRFTECERELIVPELYEPAIQRHMHQLFAQFRMQL